MIAKSKTLTLVGLIGLLVLLSISACGNPVTSPPQQATITPTPTVQAIVSPPTPAVPPSACEGLAGELEIQVLVGPAEAVGLTPHAVGSIPFAVTTNEAPYLIEGSGGFEYADILAEQWGTFEVTMNMSGFVQGDCVADQSSAELSIYLEMEGSQVTVVTVDGFSQTYPWEGTLPFDLNFPLEEGASMEGEGYAIVLHLKQK